MLCFPMAAILKPADSAGVIFHEIHEDTRQDGRQFLIDYLIESDTIDFTLATIVIFGCMRA